MAVRGRKPTPTSLRVIEGTKSRSPNLPEKPVVADGRPTPPPYVRGRILELWNEYLPDLPWLTKLDGPKFGVWCRAEADNEKNGHLWATTRHAEHRKLGAELGFDYAGGMRLSGAADKPKADPTEEFFATRA